MTNKQKAIEDLDSIIDDQKLADYHGLGGVAFLVDRLNKVISLLQNEECSDGRKVEDYTVVEYEMGEHFLKTSCPNGVKSAMTDEQIKRFEKHYEDKNVKVGSVSCKDDCEHFKGHEIQGKSIRCGYKDD
jgi:hypothetical protein